MVRTRSGVLVGSVRDVLDVPRPHRVPVRIRVRSDVPGLGHHPALAHPPRARKGLDGRCHASDTETMNSGERIRPPDRPLAPGETYIDYGPALPGKYGILTIHALVRDPRCVFAYWEWPQPESGRAWAVRLRDVDSRT